MSLADLIFYSLAVVWGFGLIGGSIGMGVWMWRNGAPVMGSIFSAILLPPAVFLAALPWLFLHDAQSPDLVTLKKGQWKCGASHTVTTATPMMVGKVMIMTPHTSTVCDAYVRAERR